MSASLTTNSAIGQVTEPFTALQTRNAPASSQKGLADQFLIMPAAQLVYDSNALRLNDERAGSAPRDDVRTTPAVEFDIRQQFARNSISVTGSVGYDFHSRFTRLERLRTNAAADAVVPVGGRCVLRPGADMRIQQADVEDLGVSTGSTLRLFTGRLVAECPRSAGFYPVASVDVLRLTNSGNNNGLNRTNWNATGGIVYALPSVGQFQLFASGGQARRSNPLSQSAGDLGIDTASVGLQFDRAVTSRFATRIVVSAVHADPLRSSTSSFDGINYLVNVRIAPFPALVISPSVSRKVAANVNAGADYFILNDASVGMSLALSARAALTTQIARGKRRYFGEDPLVRPQLRIADTTDSIQMGFRYAVRSLQLQMGISHRNRDSVNNFYDFSGTQVEFSARIGL